MSDNFNYLRIKVYTASKIEEYSRWNNLRTSWQECEFTAGWIDEAHELETPENATMFWLRDADDIARSDVVLVFGTFEKHGFNDNQYQQPLPLRGALVEAGIGIALGKQIIVVGDHPSYGTWQYHPLVYKVDTLQEARQYLGILLNKLRQVGVLK